MGCVNIDREINIEIELTDFEQNNLIQSYKILKNIQDDMWRDDADETDVFARVSEAKDFLEEFIRRDLGIDVKQN